MATLREILETLRQTYCGKIGCEYMNIQVPEQKRWLQHRMEHEANNWPLDNETRVRILRSIIGGEEFEHFLHSRFVGQKRFALEGGETALAILDEFLERAAVNNVHEIVIGLAHRGRRIRSGRVSPGAALAGAHVGTMPYKVLDSMFNHPLTDKGLAQFLKDWEKAKQ